MRTIRRAQSKDALAIEKLYLELNTLSKPTVSAERIGALANSEHTHVLVCEESQRVIASALVCLCQDIMFDRQPFAVVENLVVSKTYKRLGVGKTLLNYIEELCLQSDCSKIVLQTGSDNRDACVFYNAMGYNPDTKIGFIKYRRHFS